MSEPHVKRHAPAALGALALAAGGSALAGWWRTKAEVAAAHPPLGAFVEADGVRLHYIDVGPRDAPVLLFLHGNGACIEDLTVSGLIDVLAPHYRCIVPDRPGYGHSTRPGGRSYTPEDQAALMVAFLKAIGIERPIAIGHSWGTLVAANMALDPREPVSGAVLMSGYYYPQDRSDVFVMGLPSTPVIGPALVWTLGPPAMRRMAPKLLGRMFAPCPVPERVRADYPFAYGERPSQIRAATAELAAMRRAVVDLGPRYAAFPVPVALLHGEEDRAIPPAAHSTRLAGEIPGAPLTLLPGLGHMIHYFAHDAIRAAIDTVAARRVPPLRAAGA